MAKNTVARKTIDVLYEQGAVTIQGDGSVILLVKTKEGEAGITLDSLIGMSQSTIARFVYDNDNGVKTLVNAERAIKKALAEGMTDAEISAMIALERSKMSEEGKLTPGQGSS
jgi:hypothetical protein